IARVVGYLIGCGFNLTGWHAPSSPNAPPGGLRAGTAGRRAAFPFQRLPRAARRGLLDAGCGWRWCAPGRRWPTPRRSARALVRVVVEARRMLPSGVAGFGRRRLDRRPLDGVGVELAAEQGAGASDAGVGRAAGQKTAVEPLAGWDDVHAVL
ncbi:MAG: hypothetical protein KC583_17650, partial [Myxococcales bacterium]|nr:hypothetical protein [Myxococcales bacterium]